MKKNIVCLRDKHKDADIWVIASGSSMDYIKPNFFDRKIVVGVNQVYKRYRCNYLVRKESKLLKETYDTGISLIVSEYDCGNRLGNLNEVKGRRTYYYFDHEQNQHTVNSASLDVIGTDKIVVSHSSITSALHVAAYLGAKNIILCGHDCGKLDGKLNFAGYYQEPIVVGQGYGDWVSGIEPATKVVRDKLVEVYGCNIHSLNPFINLGIEGHAIGR